MACDAPEDPQISVAIGKISGSLNPSKSPKIKENKIKDSKLNPWKNGAAAINIVHIPMDRNETCWSRIRLLLTVGKSAIHPMIKRPTKEVMAM